MARLIALLLASATLAACSSHAPPDSAAAASTAPAPAATNIFAGTPLSPYGHDLNKAKNVQNIANQRAAKQAKALDDATGDGH